MPRKNSWRSAHRVFALGVVGGALVAGLAFLFAQQPSPRKAPIRKAPAQTATTPAPPPAKPQYKGIWEPVNYSEDLQLTDIFCVSVDVCYVSGAAGTILKTIDGGTTWNVQLGGNPESQEGTISHLRFIDETHGWAYQDRGKLLRTTDGETWEEHGSLGDPVGWGAEDYAFVSETVGVQMVGNLNYIAQTRDGGRTWEKVWPQCRIKMEIQGLAKNVSCHLKSFQFISPSVGFAAGATQEGNAFFVLKTEDGGETWAVLSVVPEVTHEHEFHFRQEIFFIDDNVGFLVLVRSGKFFATTDGGQSWRALVATVKGRMKFADPEVAWALGEYNEMPSSTTNGGMGSAPER